MTYWFKRRRYGYGWTPSSWQGWVTFAVFLLLVLAPIPFLPQGERHGGPNPYAYIFFVLVVMVVFILIVVKKGPKAHWRWGTKDNDDPDEDF